MDYTQQLIAGLLILTVVAALIAPMLRYLAIGWHAKRKDIMNGLGAQARLVYFRMFCQCEPIPGAADASKQFEKLYSKWYGRRLFLAPGLLFTVVGLILSTLVILTALTDSGYLTANPLFQLKPTAIAAIAGAYLWVLNDQISRSRRLDFSPADLSWGSLRLIISVPMGFAFASVASESAGPFVAFALGTFPLSALQSMLRRLADKHLQMEKKDDDATSDDIIRLQGINKSILERLADEDIQTVTQVAYCDPVHLTMRSNLTFEFVCDCMNQALAWIYLEGGLDAVRPLGLRGAHEIRCFVADLDNLQADPASQSAHNRAVAALPFITKALKQEDEAVQFMLRQIASDWFTIFLKEVWDDTHRGVREKP